MLISKVTGPSVQATIVASRKQANNLYLRRRRYVCEEKNEGSNLLCSSLISFYSDVKHTELFLLAAKYGKQKLVGKSKS